MKAFKVLKSSVFGIYVVSGVLLALFLLPQTGLKALTVATGSMTPAIPQGSLVVIKNVAPRTLQVGDVVTYMNPLNPKQTITHRIQRVTTKFNLPAFITKGDANSVADPMIMGGNVVGKVMWHVPVLGKVISWVRSPLGLALVVILPGILIIVDELRRLGKTLYATDASDKSKLRVPAFTPVKAPILASAGAAAKSSLTTAPQPKLKPRRSMDFIRIAALIVLPLLLIAHTFANLLTQATLTNNTIALIPPANHVLIDQVFLGSAGGNGCNQNNSVNVSATGPNSATNVTTQEACTVTSTGSTNINMNNNTDQTAVSGPAVVSNSTSGANAVSGDASNSSNSTFTVTIGNSAPTNTPAQTEWVELSNPTSQAVSVQNWSLTDSGGTLATLGNITVSANGTLKIDTTLLGHAFANSLNPAGDKVLLKNSSGTVVDAVNWGTDHSQFNPAVAALTTGETLKRKFSWLDTDSASDWTVQP